MSRVSSVTRSTNPNRLRVSECLLVFHSSRTCSYQCIVQLCVTQFVVAALGSNLEVVVMASLEELESQLQALKKRQAECRSEVRNLGKRARRAGAATHIAQLLHEGGANQVCPKLDKDRTRVLLLLFELASPCIDIVVSYALGQGRGDQCRGSGLDEWSPDARSSIAAGVELLYVGAPFDMVVGLLESPELQLQSLARYVVEYHLFHWLTGQNCDKGVAPRSGQVFAEAPKHLPAQAPLHLRQKMRKFFLSADRAARYWLVSFQQRWGVKIRLLGAGEDLEPGQLECKVSQIILAIHRAIFVRFLAFCFVRVGTFPVHLWPHFLV